MNDVDSKIVEYLRASARVKTMPDAALLAAPLRELIDSIGMMEFLSFLEETFAISISDDEVTPETFETPASSIAYIHAKLVAKSDTVG